MRAYFDETLFTGNTTIDEQHKELIPEAKVEDKIIPIPRMRSRRKKRR